MSATNPQQPLPLLLFGPQITHISEGKAGQIRNAILDNPKLSFIKKTVESSSEILDMLHDAAPSIDVNGIRPQLQALTALLNTGQVPSHQDALGSSFYAPLTVIIQAVAYSALNVRGRVQGFCIGFLTAASVAAAKDEAGLQDNLQRALNLAILIGAIVDAAAETHGSVQTYSVQWPTPDVQKSLQDFFQRHPSSYICCYTDLNRATITIAEPDEIQFVEDAAKLKLNPLTVGLRRRYHWKEHKDLLCLLERLCYTDDRLRLPDASELQTPLRSNSDAREISSGNLSVISLQSILVEPSQWYSILERTITSAGGRPNVIQLDGPSNLLPTSLHGLVNSVAKDDEGKSSRTTMTYEPIAVIGLACRYPDSNSLDEFWRLLAAGHSTARPVPKERFDIDQINRELKDDFVGNFLDAPDAFDHRFFGISGREAKSMDPQQRLALQVAYEALESAGYASRKDNLGKQTGCYLGVGSVDYEANVASENATSFSATGTLRAFISGRISHFWGWSGPSMTYDTACSSSAVAIHSACRALHLGECETALAGGVHVITAPTLYQNLAAASFLNAEGMSKAFDADAAGYCRGEGAGMVLLKPLKRAIADNDFILATISGSAVNQGDSCTPITVPHSDSQSALYQRTLQQAGIQNEEVSFVEAHGTGTPVGDPIECESIRRTFGGPSRPSTVYFGSVKDNIGHTEGASGAAGLIKVLMMMHNRAIPKQANFVRLNSKIPVLEPDHLSIPTELIPWKGGSQLTALVNNYGAAGSNAAILVREYLSRKDSSASGNSLLEGKAVPFGLYANSETSLRQYATKLLVYVQRTRPSVPDMAFNLAHKKNTDLEHFYGWTNTGGSETLIQELTALSSGSATITSRRRTSPTCILCFGGQGGKQSSIFAQLYQASPRLQYHLKRCDAVLLSLGSTGILPRVFDDRKEDDVVLSHTRLFCVQFACAMTWIDCGVQPTALIGHSFGQLTALCVGGGMSLHDALGLVVTRARLMRDQLDSEHGAMLAVEGPREAVEALIADSATTDEPAEIVCLNGETSFVIAASTNAIKEIESAYANKRDLGITAMKRLDSKYAYHSTFMEPILDSLRKAALEVQFEIPRITVETCTPDERWPEPTAERIVDHTRRPVHFQAAVERLSRQYCPAVWLEAGSASSIIPMVRRVLQPAQTEHVYVPVDVTGGLGVLSSAVVKLQETSIPASFWPFERSKTQTYQWLPVPPYQFEQHSHWIEYQPPSHPDIGTSAQPQTTLPATFLSAVSISTKAAQFAVNSKHEYYVQCVTGHAVLGQSLCPASLYVEMLAHAMKQLGGFAESENSFQLRHLEILSPLTLIPQGPLALHMSLDATNIWSFRVTTQPEDGTVLHAKGQLSIDDAKSAEQHFESLERLVHPSKHQNIEESATAETLSGSIIYKIFGNVVDYADYFHGVRKIVAASSEALGVVLLPPMQPKALDDMITAPITLDNFLQVAGIHVNCLSTSEKEKVYVCTAIDNVTLRPGLAARATEGTTWRIYTNFRRVAEGVVVNDIYATLESTGELYALLQGARFTSVPLKTLTRTLSRLNGVKEETQPTQHKFSENTHQQFPIGPTGQLTPPDSLEEEDTPAHDIPSGQDAMRELCEVIARVLEVSVDEVSSSADLVDLGIDSLLSAEVAMELNKHFGSKLSGSDLVSYSDLPGVCAAISPSTVQAEQTAQPETTPDPVPKLAPTSKTQLTAPPVEAALDCCTAVVNWMSNAGSSYDAVVHEVELAGFYNEVYPRQMQLVCIYITDAFKELGCDLSRLSESDELPPIKHSPTHEKAVRQYYAALAECDFIQRDGDCWRRTRKPLPTHSNKQALDDILSRYPKHRSEHLLLQTTGSRLADCLTGVADPVGLLFKDSAARELLQDVYTNAPMFKAGTVLLSRALLATFDQVGNSERPVRILELGAGTGGTTNYILQQLVSSRHDFEYTFSDLSPSLVAAAKRRFAKYADFMKYAVIDIEQDQSSNSPLGQFDIVISTNCIHATRNLTTSGRNINTLLREDGVLCLVELVQNLFWFDLVFGLLEGWWLFNDGRTHALASAERWKSSLSAAGFRWIDWTRGKSQESNLLRVILASPSSSSLRSASPTVNDKSASNGAPDRECFTYKEVDELSLQAEVYYPSEGEQSTAISRPVALMIHGGGHVMLSRGDLRSQQTSLLLRQGFLPISIDYRLCPEVDIVTGPMKDVLDALIWIRSSLPAASKRVAKIADTQRVVAVGWSTGGHLAMSLGWTAVQAGISPPEAVLAFYNPSNYADPFWLHPNIPQGSEQAAQTLNLGPQELSRGLFDTPILAYNPPPQQTEVGGWMAPEDPRSRIALWANWKGKHLQLILHGRKALQDGAELDSPTPEEIDAINPRHWIDNGVYRTPTFLIHGTKDDLIPWQQAQSTLGALRSKAVPADGRIIENAIHLFDIVPGWRGVEAQDQAVKAGYEFLRQHVR